MTDHAGRHSRPRISQNVEMRAITIRIPADLFEAMKEQAARSKRSFVAEAEVAFEAYLQDAKGDEKAAVG